MADGWLAERAGRVKKRMKASASIEEVLDRHLRDPAEASLYLNTVLADGDPQALKIAIRDVIRTRGGVAEVARSAAMKREAVSRALSVRGNRDWIR